MPLVDRIEATRAIKASTTQTKVLFLSVHPAYLQDGLDAGADAALLKDVGRAELLFAINQLTAQR